MALPPVPRLHLRHRCVLGGSTVTAESALPPWVFWALPPAPLAAGPAGRSQRHRCRRPRPTARAVHPGGVPADTTGTTLAAREQGVATALPAPPADVPWPFPPAPPLPPLAAAALQGAKFRRAVNGVPTLPSYEQADAPFPPAPPAPPAAQRFPPAVGAAAAVAAAARLTSLAAGTGIGPATQVWRPGFEVDPGRAVERRRPVPETACRRDGVGRRAGLLGSGVERARHPHRGALCNVTPGWPLSVQHEYGRRPCCRSSRRAGGGRDCSRRLRSSASCPAACRPSVATSRGSQRA